MELIVTAPETSLFLSREIISVLTSSLLASCANVIPKALRTALIQPDFGTGMFFTESEFHLVAQELAVFCWYS